MTKQQDHELERIIIECRLKTKPMIVTYIKLKKLMKEIKNEN